METLDCGMQRAAVCHLMAGRRRDPDQMRVSVAGRTLQIVVDLAEAQRELAIPDRRRTRSSGPSRRGRPLVSSQSLECAGTNAGRRRGRRQVEGLVHELAEPAGTSTAVVDG